MTAICRVGGEWQQGPVGAGASAFTGGYGAKVSVVTPGRTGGALYLCERGATSAAATVASGALHTQVPDNVPLIGRIYFKINQYPATGADGIPIFELGSNWYTGVGALYAFLFDDGTLGVAFADSTSGDLADAPTTVPLDEWVLLEMMVTWSATEDRRVAVRVTYDGEDPQVVYTRCHLAALEPDSDPIAPAAFTAGMLRDAGTGFEIELDDMGLNLGEGTENRTWLGPGEVRMARPVSDGAAARVFEAGGRDNTGRGVQDGTVISHAPEPDEDPEICPTAAFYEALNNDPVVNPVGLSGRCAGDDIMVSSSGSDWHAHGPTLGPGAWVYDHPRIGDAGDTFEVVCDASDQTGTVNFAMVCVVGGRYNSGSALVPTPPKADKYFAVWTENETAPTAEDPADEANVNFGQWDRVFPGVDGSWEGVTGRRQQAPTLPDDVTLTFRREYDCAVVESPGGPDVYEWVLLGAGIVYESGYQPQPALPPCGSFMTLV